MRKGTHERVNREEGIYTMEDFRRDFGDMNTLFNAIEFSHNKIELVAQQRERDRISRALLINWITNQIRQIQELQEQRRRKAVPTLLSLVDALVSIVDFLEKTRESVLQPARESLCKANVECLQNEKILDFLWRLYIFPALTSYMIKVWKTLYNIEGGDPDNIEKLTGLIKKMFDMLIMPAIDGKIINDKIKMLLQQTLNELINTLEKHDFDTAEKIITEKMMSLNEAGNG